MIEPLMLQYLDGNDKDQLNDWVRSHFQWHQTIYTTAVNKGFPKYDIFTALQDIGDLEGWSYFHQMEHTNIANSLKIGVSPDLSELDPSDKDSFDSWLQVHADVHVTIRDALGII